MALAASLFGMDVGGDVLALGAITGLVYGILGVGLVLVYRSNRVINFAHGEIGAFGAAFLGAVTVNHVLPYWLAFALALLISASIAAASDAVIIRRLRDAPVLVSVIATLGLGQTLQILAGIVNETVGSGVTYPQPPGLPTFDIGALKVTQAYSAMLFITPLIVGGLAWFLSRTRLGFALRASAANADAARMAGVLTGRMSALAWGTAGAMAAYTAILVLPTRGFSGGAFLGPGLLLRALVCAVVARMSKLTVTLAAGVGLGVVESVLLANYPSSGLVEVAMFAAIVIGLLLQRADFGRASDKGTFAAVQAWAPLPEAYQRVWLIRNFGRVLALVALGVATLLPAILTNDRTSLLIVIVIFTLVGLSVGVVTSLGGQLTLGQFALAGVGAIASYHATSGSGNFLVGVTVGALTAAAVSVVIGLPALRIKGLMLAVTTLAFALAMETWGFNQRWAFGDGVVTRRPAIGSTTLTSTKQYYFVALAFLLVGLLLARNVWRSGFGRQLRAVRDNEDAARSFTIAATRVKLQGFAVAGLLAGLGGAVYGHYLSRLAGTAFPIDASISTAAIVVLGGMGVLIGPLLGALYIVGIPGFLPLDNAGLAATAAGWLALIVHHPGGLAQALGRTRVQLMERLARSAGVVAPDQNTAGAPTRPPAAIDFAALVPSEARPSDEGAVVLEAVGVVRRFGGLVAVNGVHLSVRRGETVGLIGPNGAGKTTLFEILSGFTEPDDGQVRYLGTDVTKLAPEARAGRGLIRSFQDAGLFPTLTVRETVTLALERRDPTRFAHALLGVRSGERRKQARAEELLDAMGLHDYRHHQIRALSTGTRRITELACLVAMAPTVLLLDEPTSGIAQRETEALGRVLANVKEQLGLTMVVIEHDIPLVMSLSDRIIAMETGTVIADGRPHEIARNPRVISSYLGEDTAALQRSDVVEAHAAGNGRGARRERVGG